MSTKTKYGKRGIAALCGAAVLFAGEVSSVNVFAEQTEQDSAVAPAMSMEAPADPDDRVADIIFELDDGSTVYGSYDRDSNSYSYST